MKFTNVAALLSLLSVALLLAVPTSSAAPAGPTVPVTITSDGSLFVIQSNTRHALASIDMPDDVINSLPEGDPYADGQAPASTSLTATLRTDGAIYLIAAIDGQRHLLTPVAMSDDAIWGTIAGEPYVGSDGSAAGAPALPAAVQAAAAAANPTNPTTIHVVATEWSLTPDVTSVPAGKYTFELSVPKSSRFDHELQVIKSNLPLDKLPLAPGGREVDEAKVGKKTEEIEGVTPGDTQSAVGLLGPGRYVLFCNVTNHYGKGLAAELTVN